MSVGRLQTINKHFNNSLIKFHSLLKVEYICIAESKRIQTRLKIVMNHYFLTRDALNISGLIRTETLPFLLEKQTAFKSKYNWEKEFLIFLDLGGNSISDINPRFSMTDLCCTLKRYVSLVLIFGLSAHLIS